MATTIKVEGVKELLKYFRKMPKVIKTKSGKKALNKGANIIVKAARANIPGKKFTKFSGGQMTVFDTNDLRRDIGKVIRKKSNGDPYAVIGEKQSRFAWGHWLEFGTLAHRQAPLKKKRSSEAQKLADRGMGIVKHPFLRPAFLEKGPIVQDQMFDILIDSIIKVAERETLKI